MRVRIQGKFVLGLIVVLLIYVVISLISRARADDVTIQVTDQWKSVLLNAQTSVDQCVGAGQVHADYSKCRDLWTFLGTLANLPTTPVAKPATPAKPDAEAPADAPKN